MTEYNDIGISRQLDWARIKKLLAIGLFGGVLHLIGDMILGWGVEDETMEGVLRMMSAYTGTSDGELLAVTILGLFGMVLEGLSLFGIYRLMAEQSPKHAHRFRAGIFGYLMFGSCGFHLPVCAMTFLANHGLAEELLLQYMSYFIAPSFLLFWIFFLVMEITYIQAFAKGLTPYPKWCGIFSMLVGMIVAMIPGAVANVPLCNAITCAWIAIGNVWMFGGLLVMLKKVQK